MINNNNEVTTQKYGKVQENQEEWEQAAPIADKISKS
jgi:hypothetical protein